MSMYYMQFVAWVLIYTFHSLQSPLPWGTCSREYNSKQCYTLPLQETCRQKSNYSVYYDFRCMSADEFCRANGHLGSNGTHCWGTALPEMPSHRLSARKLDSAPARSPFLPLASGRGALAASAVVGLVALGLGLLSSLLVLAARGSLGFLLVGYAWPQVRGSVTQLLELQWAACLLLLCCTLGLKMASDRERFSAIDGGTAVMAV
ncbi:uncharacterized protein LOC119102751 [Pollicipes pollicipes]|uniref:uncharacterized protein LOC119102751 n=1 Tax=Pollicipes pollicipes TaxID=41117 RepID=UPI00188536B1|nr:uncharacterized protein LOC119102751 [Pollicipes pollicipes]